MSFACPAWPPDCPEIAAALDAAFRSGQWGRYHSRLCSDLEARLAAEYDVPLARVCCSGTAALEIALRTLQLNETDEVIVSAYDYPGNLRTIELVGARPVLVDVDPQTASLNPRHLSEADSPNVRAVIATHLYGQAAEMEAIGDHCQQRGWTLIEDACQVIGMKVGGRAVGSFGDVATLSFGGSKLISAGGGGALLVKSERLAARVGPLLDRPGETFPLAPLQAAVIAPQLDRLEEWNRRRAETAAWLASQRSQWPDWVPVQRPDPANEPAYYKLAWLCPDSESRAQLIAAAKDRNVPIGAGFRSAAKVSPRRCRKPVSLEWAEQFGARLFVLDHRALLIEEHQRADLMNELRALHAGGT